MDLSDYGRLSTARPASIRALAADPLASADCWPDLVARIGAEIAGPLTTALERITTLAHTGKIDRVGLRALREEIEAARRAGIIGQQLTRFLGGRIRQAPERMALAEVLGGVVAHRAREAAARGVELHAPQLDPVDLRVDPPLLFGLLNSAVDWTLANAGTAAPVEIGLENRGWPAGPRLTWRFAERAPTEGGAARGSDWRERRDEESLAWSLLEATAQVLGVIVEQRIDAEAITLSLDFPRQRAPLAGSHAAGGDDGFAPSTTNSQPLAGSRVLVIAAHRDLRAQIGAALRSMSLIVDFVASIDAAESFCREGLPHAVIVESAQVGDRFAQFRDELTREVPALAFVEIVEEGAAFEMSDFHGAAIARVGRAALASALPSALLFELSPCG